MKRLVLVLITGWALALSGCEDDPTDLDYLEDAGADAGAGAGAGDE